MLKDSIIQMSPIDYHIKKICALVDTRAIRKRHFRVALDTVNGAGGDIAQKLLKKLGCSITGINLKMNGRFAHTPEPTPANLISFSEFMRGKKIDIGFALDPDADRLVLVSPTGEVLVEEYTLAIAVWHFLNHIKKGSVVINQSTSMMSEVIAAKAKCRAYRSAVGEMNVVQEMMKRKAVLGGEGNGGIIDPRLHYGRDGIHGMALILEALAVSNKTLPEIIETLTRFHIVKDKQSLKDNFPNILVKLKKHPAFKNAALAETDGLRFAWKNKWLHIRPSNTEPIIRIIAEARTGQEARALIKKMKKIIKIWTHQMD